VRQALNMGVARLSLLTALLSLAVTAPLVVLASPIAGLVSLALASLSALAWLLGRRGGAGGALLLSLVLLIVALCGVTPAAEAPRADVGVNVLYLLPVLYAAVFVRPSAAWWYFGAEVLVVGGQLLFAGHPNAIRSIALLALNVGFATALTVYAADMLSTLLGQMEDEVAARTEQLSAALGLQRRLNASRIRLMQDIAHDLDNRLVVVHGNIAMLHVTIEDMAACRPVPEGEQAPLVLGRLDDAVRAASRYARLIRDAALLEQGEFPLRLGPVDMVGLANEVAASFLDSFRYAGIALAVLEPAGLIPPVWADRDLCWRVIENMLVNALRFARPGMGGQRVTVTISQTMQVVEVAVRDVGRGVDPERMAELGRRFTQLHRGEIVEGKGMGLSFCARALRAMGGELRFTSAGVNQGATVTMLLPVAAVAVQTCIPCRRG
jgi:signal transduction histidine kinase